VLAFPVAFSAESDYLVSVIADRLIHKVSENFRCFLHRVTEQLGIHLFSSCRGIFLRWHSPLVVSFPLSSGPSVTVRFRSAGGISRHAPSTFPFRLLRSACGSLDSGASHSAGSVLPARDNAQVRLPLRPSSSTLCFPSCNHYHFHLRKCADILYSGTPLELYSTPLLSLMMTTAFSSLSGTTGFTLFIRVRDHFAELALGSLPHFLAFSFLRCV